MTTLHYIKASDVEQDFCFLEVSQGKNEAPFMDIRISDDRKMSFVIYSRQQEIFLSPEEWLEIQEKAIETNYISLSCSSHSRKRRCI